MHKVFVYGSLKNGFSNHTLLQKQKFIGTYITEKAIYQMQHLGAFPGVTLKGNQYIQGELYDVDDSCLEQLDVLEENGTIYQRELVKLANYSESCWMYFLLKSKSPIPETLEKFLVGLTDQYNSYNQIAIWKKQVA